MSEKKPAEQAEERRREEAEALLREMFAAQCDLTKLHVWRGQANAEWLLEPTLYRRIRNAHLPEEITEELVRKYETDLLCDANGLGFYKGDRLATMVSLQHHGGATRLLDVSRNLYVSLWFATSGEPASDGVMFHFGIPPERVHRYDKLSSFDDIQSDRNSGRPFLYFPRPDEERVKAQQAGFLVTVLARPLSDAEPFVADPAGLTVQRFVVPSALKSYLHEYLTRVIGLDGVGVYPDFEGFSMANGSQARFARSPDSLYHGRDGLFPN
ncbi:FRG domain-containing protein [Cellulosimicrobium cellulans]|uniref:FRG domain-containing protein n=1 Tax=Cellulosimicrobium cellulans TaxID=1710 RepID=UPI001BACD50A|nr:FRG domain-containing protein [Cellulosimicrobium cellulans]QUB99406.1 FRG domain-containing protein [Cellulosimicrobium cellulans]